jgi:hypothetical protein
MARRTRRTAPARTRSVKAVIVENVVAVSVASGAADTDLLEVVPPGGGASFFFVEDARFPGERFRVEVRRWPGN